MLLNRIEFAMMNNPIRSAVQRHFEARRLLRMGGEMDGGRALEVGCGRGVGAELIFRLFEADSIDAFDLDPRMVALARTRLSRYGARARFWVGDVNAISAPDETYDAVFDFGIIHHVPEWRGALTEIYRVLRPGGRFYAEEVLKRGVLNPISRMLLEHPQTDRFDMAAFRRALEAAGFETTKAEEFHGYFAWFTAQKRGAAQQ